MIQKTAIHTIARTSITLNQPRRNQVMYSFKHKTQQSYSRQKNNGRSFISIIKDRIQTNLNCGSCQTTIDLDLKFLVHYGELTMIKVKISLNLMEEKSSNSSVIKNHTCSKNMLFTENMHTLYQDNMIENWTKKIEIYDLKN
jgi:hypothetical protein